MTTLRDTGLRTVVASPATWGARPPADGNANGTGNGNGNGAGSGSGHANANGSGHDSLRGLTPGRLRTMDRTALDRLAADIRHFLVASVSETGGHLGSNLGAVELSISLHRVFDSPVDSIVWDTGHQAYVHKLLTGRAEGFARLRKAGGLSGYPSRAESEHDLVENSHASTGLGYADGLARARDLRRERHHVVAVVGDGALTGGLAYEALNNIGVSQRKVIVVLNDNGRSYAPTISPLTTACSQHGGGTDASSSAPSAFFGALGFTYTGPVDGHDVCALEAALEAAAACHGPVVVHVHTVKGRDYAPAELDEEKRLHDVSPFDVATGLPRTPKGSVPTYTEAFGEAIVREAASRPELVAVTAAMTGPTGLNAFAEHHGDRLVDVGIAEQHAVTVAAGMAMGGLRPVVAVYSTFLNRAWDQVVHDVGLHRLPVVFCLDRSGVTGDDGPSHHGIYDLALLTKVPGMTVLAPSSYEEIPVMLHDALEHDQGPVAIRWPKTPARRCAETGAGFRARLVARGDGSVCLLGVGKLLEACEQAARVLAAEGISATVWDVRVACPLDPEMLADAASHEVVVTAEDGIVEGGVGAAVASALRTGSFGGASSSASVVACGLPIAYLPHEKPDAILAAHGLDARGIADAAVRTLGTGRTAGTGRTGRTAGTGR
ncbi:MAG: 1-deoxy-D-xylulose-5-phosphate synthase [Acidimicrobiales bacterium]